MRATLVLGLLLVADLALALEVVRVAGTGASQSMLRELALEFGATHKACGVRVLDSMGSRGGLRALVAGKAELARVSREPREGDRVPGMVYKPFAMTKVVFVTHPSVTGVERLTPSELVAIYDGKIASWGAVGGPDNPIYPLTRDGGTTLRTVLGHIPSFERLPAHAKPTYSSLETMRLLLERPYTIGFVPRTLIVGTPLREVEIQGVSTPADESGTERSGMSLPLGIVYLEPLEGCPARFVDYLSAPAAHRVIRANLATPVP